LSPPLLALVLHANQYLIARRYGREGEEREGMDELADAYARVLSWHEELGVPASLHLSGTLIEAAAWHRPDLLALVRRLARRGVVDLVGGTYAENVMPIFPAALNRRQCREHLWLLRRHLDASRPRTFWVPERVWDTAALSPVIADPSLANGGYRFVVLDDRHLGVAHGEPEYWRTVGQPWRVEGGRGLKLFAVPEPLRYAVPAEGAEGERRLEGLLDEAGREAGLLVFADDLERLAGVGPWRVSGAPAYRRFLEWLAAGGGPRPTGLVDALARVPAGPERPVATAAYRELESWGAGPDYRGWWDAPAWRDSRGHLEEALRTVARQGAPGDDDGLGRASDRGGGGLADLAWKHLLATTYETAWHVPVRPSPAGVDGADGDGASAFEPAPWAVALAHQSRSVHDLLALRAALDTRWPGVHSLPPGTAAEDGAWTLGDGRLQALVAPRRGGRVVLLAGRARDRSVLLVGNPTGDWNWQREPHRFMDVPAEHPGALADRGHEHDRYEARALRTERGEPGLVLENVETGSPLLGTRKVIRLDRRAGTLEVDYHLPPGACDVVVDCALGPDYYRLLREGRDAMVPFELGRRRGARTGDVAAWVELPRSNEATFTEPRCEAGHTHGVAIRPHAPRFRFRIGGGAA
jgi:starch synthase